MLITKKHNCIYTLYRLAIDTAALKSQEILSCSTLCVISDHLLGGGVTMKQQQADWTSPLVPLSAATLACLGGLDPDEEVFLLSGTSSGSL